MNKQNETKESTATMVTDAYKSALSTDEGKEALKETMIETAELEARLAVDDASEKQFVINTRICTPNIVVPFWAGLKA
ncbi:MAG: hypothetical protein ACLT0Y_02285 [Christensenellales bacterium]